VLPLPSKAHHAEGEASELLTVQVVTSPVTRVESADKGDVGMQSGEDETLVVPEAEVASTEPSLERRTA
jgi:hypothetical protein